MTMEDYAIKSFKVDQQEGEWTKDMQFYDLPEEEIYLYWEEALAYLRLPEEEWIDFAFYGVE